jgi:hypothetical protein
VAPTSTELDVSYFKVDVGLFFTVDVVWLLCTLFTEFTGTNYCLWSLTIDLYYWLFTSPSIII